MKNILIIIAALGIISCQSDPENSTLPGRYRILSIESDVAVDLNHDGLKSTDVYAEISKPYVIPSGESMSFYDFNSMQNYAEIRGINGNGFSGLIDLRLPRQIVDDLNGSNYLMMYDHTLIACTYTLKENNLNVLHGFDQGATLSSSSVLNNGNLSVSITQQFFDFADNAWVEANIVVEYEKLN